MDLSLIIARLKAQLVGFKQIGGAAELAAATDGAVTVPAAFVMPLAENAEANAFLSSHEQRITQAFAVVLVTANRRDATGAAALQELAPLRGQVRAALAGWAPDEEGLPVEMTGGRTLSLDGDGRLWWSDEFTLHTYYRSL